MMESNIELKTERKLFFDSYPQVSRYHLFLKQFIKKRKVLIWSATNKSDWILETIQEFCGGKVSGYIDQRADELITFHGLPVYAPESALKEKDPGSYCIYVALENRYSDVAALLDRFGYQEYADYLYPSCHPVSLTRNSDTYFDMQGNEIWGAIDGFKVTCCANSKLIIGDHCDIDASVSIVLEKNAVLRIGNHCRIGKNVTIKVRNSLLSIGDECVLEDSSDLNIRWDSLAVIGMGSTFGRHFTMGITQTAVCHIGCDCMFSANIRIQGTDGHCFFDLDDNEIVNQKKKYTTKIGNHVWVGAQSIIRYGSDIGDGSIVGMGSLVMHSFPPNVILAGTPAVIRRNHVAWVRSIYPFCGDISEFQNFDFR
ncbi:MAG: acyltransferase [Lachnospiraceae bacterium]|nr:acyltransferase [Lachnospiraceae bacterium]